MSDVIGMLIAAAVQASPEVIVRVLSYGTYGNGNVFVYLDRPVNQPGCEVRWMEFPADSPAAKSVLALAAVAVSTDSMVRVVADTCYMDTASFSGARASYFQLEES